MARDSDSRNDMIREINEVFEGKEGYELVSEIKDDRMIVKKQRKKTFDRLATAKGRPLEPILEENNDYALVPVVKDREEAKRKRNEGIKQRARLVSGRTDNRPHYYQFGKEDTFLTGGGLPGKV